MPNDTAPAWPDPKLIVEFNAVMDRAGQAFLEKSPHGSYAEWRRVRAIAAIRFIVSAQSARVSAAFAAGAMEMREMACNTMEADARAYEAMHGASVREAARVLRERQSAIRATPLPDTTALDRLPTSAQWDAFNRVLHWVNEQTEQMIDKKHLYQAVMEMRPVDVTLNRLLAEAREEAISKTKDDLIVWCLKQQQIYLDPRYATNQPSSSFGERHALAAVIDHLRARSTPA